MIRTLLTVLGGMLILSGAVWFFQGIGVLPGSFMSGQIQWAVYGGLAVVVGGGVVYFARRRK